VKLNEQEVVIPVRMNDGLENVFWTRSWQTDVIERLVDADDGLFVDVGANIGQTLLNFHLAHSEAHYVGFEPNAACVSYLNELVQVNAIQNCQVIPIGLADTDICKLFFRNKDALTDPSGSIVPDLRPNRSFQTDIVPCFKFDGIRKNLNLGKIGFVKIDVEGAELEALAGMRGSIQDCRPLVLCEVLFTDSKADLSAAKFRNEKLMQFLMDMRYQVLQLIKSADAARLVETRKIQAFPSAYWTVENKELCDYLFVPDEKETHVTNSLSS